MQKIPTLYVRDFSPESRGRFVTEELSPGCEWVLTGEGVPTRKYDGTCVMFDGDRWWARREVKAGASEPDGFVPVERDDSTGKTVGWEPIEQSGWHKWYLQATIVGNIGPGTYELCGPKVNGNPEKRESHVLIRHASAERIDPLGRDPKRIVLDLAPLGIEGVVWHHPDGRMAKLKVRDYPLSG